MEKKERQMRTIESAFTVRETSNEAQESEKRVEGYFAVFDGTYQIADGMTESIDPHAFDRTIGGDVRALIDHETALVLGRTAANTLELRIDEHGLWGSVLINPKDQDALNLYARVERGDVNQCSFGFEITEEETEFRDDGSIHWTIKDLNLYEVSVCTFPAYKTTEVTARSEQAKEIRKRALEAWKQRQAEAHPWLKKGDTKDVETEDSASA